MSAEEAAEWRQQLLDHIRFCTVNVANLLPGHLEAMWQELRALVAGRGSQPHYRGRPQRPPPMWMRRRVTILRLCLTLREGARVTILASRQHGLRNTSLLFFLFFPILSLARHQHRSKISTTQSLSQVSHCGWRSCRYRRSCLFSWRIHCWWAAPVIEELLPPSP